MYTGRSQPSIVIDVQVLVTHAASVATMEREMGTPRVSSAPQMCVISSTRAMKSGCRAWWTAGNRMASRRRWSRSSQRGDSRPATVIPHHNPAKGGQAVIPERLPLGWSARPVHA
jgi:hypothetical protein